MRRENKYRFGSENTKYEYVYIVVVSCILGPRGHDMMKKF